MQGYLRFAKLKRDQHVREVVSTINDFKADHLRAGVRLGADVVTADACGARRQLTSACLYLQDMYNYKELTQMFTELADDTKKLMDKVKDEHMSQRIRACWGNTSVPYQNIPWLS